MLVVGELLRLLLSGLAVQLLPVLVALPVLSRTKVNARVSADRLVQKHSKIGLWERVAVLFQLSAPNQSGRLRPQ